MYLITFICDDLDEDDADAMKRVIAFSLMTWHSLKILIILL